MNSNASDSNQSTGEDIGSYIVQITTTLINQLNALRMDGYIVTLGAKDATSTPSLIVRYAPEAPPCDNRTLLTTLATLQIRGWDLNRLNPTSKESLLPFLGRLVGRSSQEVEDTLQELSSHTSTPQEQRCSSSRLDTVTVHNDGSLSVRGYSLSAMAWSAWAERINTYSQQRAAETRSSSDGQGSQQLRYHQPAQVRYYNDFAYTARNGDLY